MRRLICADCGRDLRSAQAGDNCSRCSIHGSTIAPHQQRRDRFRQRLEAGGVYLFSALVGGSAAGLVLTKGVH